MAQVYFSSSIRDLEIFFRESIFVDILLSDTTLGQRCKTEIRKWLEHNCEESVFLQTRWPAPDGHVRIYFDSEDDAMKFKLSWI